MKRLCGAAALIALAALAAAPAAQAEFGLQSFEVTFTEERGPGPGGEGGPEATQSGSHPYSVETTFDFNLLDHPSLGLIPDEAVRDQVITQIEGLAGDTTVMPACTTREFLEPDNTPCEDETAVGRGLFRAGSKEEGAEIEELAPIYNMEAPYGTAARLGFKVLNIPIVLLVSVDPEAPNNIVVSGRSVPQTIPVYGADVEIWGNPSDPIHDDDRGECAVSDVEDPASVGCSVELPDRPFLTAPRACEGPLFTAYEVTSWQDPGDPVSGKEASPADFGECATLPFGPEVEAAPTTNRAESPSGFEFAIDVENPGLGSNAPGARADSDLKKAVVTLPEGMVVNAAAANGLGACTAAQLGRESASSPPGAGCPDESKVATVEVTTPLLEETLSGAIFLAQPFENPLGTLLAGYLVIKQPERGVIVKLAGKIEADPSSGQISASFDQNPQLPFSRLEVSFPGGPKGALITPQACGAYAVKTELYPWSGDAPQVQSDPFQITQGPGAEPCAASEAALPNAPGFEAGTVEPVAGRYSPLVINLRRDDGSQRFRRLTLNPPPGLVAKLAATTPCPDTALAAAAARDGAQEQAAPSCPASSRLGSVFASAGAGPAPYWAPGDAYLAGPYKGAPLSVAVIAPAVAGPFDLGTVVIRSAAHIDPKTARISVVSDPIPHILQGIPLDIRSASIRIDRPDFTLNPTSCEPFSFSGWLISTLGSNAHLQSPFQLAECTRLGFRPRLALQIRGGIGRGAYQALRAVVRPRAGDANIGRTVVRFPRSAFVAQENFRTICTRVQFAAEACPAGSVYGRAVAYSPLLGYPLRGAVYLRSSDNTLPDVVADLRGPSYQPIRVELVGRTDSVKGALRNTFDLVPDAPVSYFRLDLLGGRRALIVNSRNVCAGSNRAAVAIRAQNGLRRVLRPRVHNPRCKRFHQRRRG